MLQNHYINFVHPIFILRILIGQMLYRFFTCDLLWEEDRLRHAKRCVKTAESSLLFPYEDGHSTRVVSWQLAHPLYLKLNKAVAVCILFLQETYRCPIYDNDGRLTFFL